MKKYKNYAKNRAARRKDSSIRQIKNGEPVKHHADPKKRLPVPLGLSPLAVLMAV